MAEKKDDKSVKKDDKSEEKKESLDEAQKSGAEPSGGAKSSGPQNKTILEGLRETTIIMPAFGGDYAFFSGEFTPYNWPITSQIAANGCYLVQKFMERGMAEIPALTVAATFIAENGCDCGGCDWGEYDNFMRAMGRSGKYSTPGQSQKTLNDQVNQWKQYGCPGYGEGIGSWTFYGMKSLVLKTQGIGHWRPFYMFDLDTQIDMAWKMLETYQTAAHAILMQPECTIEMGLDACLRGVENGGGATMATPEQIDEYKWMERFSTTGSGYEGGMNMHLGAYNSVYAHWAKCKNDNKDPAAGAKLSAQATGYSHGGKEVETLPGFRI